MDVTWADVAHRAIQGLGVEAGELVLVRDMVGRSEVLSEILLAAEQQGATPLPEILPPDRQRRFLQTAPVSYLASWDQHRLGWVQHAHRVLVLEGAELDTEGISAEVLGAWAAAADRLGAVDEERRLPYLLVAVPTAERAAALGLSLPELDAILVPALAADTAQLRREITRVRTAVERAGSLTIRSGGGCEMVVALGDRPWLDDDGVITAEDQARGAQVVMNLPSGSVYTTVLEEETRGRVRLMGAGDDESVTLRFEDGGVARVEDGTGAETVQAMFDRHSGDANRIRACPQTQGRGARGAAFALI